MRRYETRMLLEQMGGAGAIELQGWQKGAGRAQAIEKGDSLSQDTLWTVAP
jgi:hypothetical protein